LKYVATSAIVLNLNISAVRYNAFTNQVEITYRNNADVATYFKGSYTVIEGDREQSFGDLEPIFIGANSYKTVVYDVEPLISDNATLDFYTIFGESRNSLEFILQGTMEISTVEIRDDTKIDFENVYYDRPKERFVVEYRNVGEKEVFVDTEIIDIRVQKERITLTSDEIIDIRPGKTKKSYIPIILSDEDIEDNPEIRVRGYYGEREAALIKIIEGTFEMAVKEATIITYLPTILIMILALLVILSMTKKKCPNCGHKNYKHKKRCRKCKVSLK
jgi:hypothetical protein